MLSNTINNTCSIPRVREVKNVLRIKSLLVQERINSKLGDQQEAVQTQGRALLSKEQLLCMSQGSCISTLELRVALTQQK